LIVLIRIGYAYKWTGFGQSTVDETVQPSKTLWDWLNLLIVPVVLALGGYLFNRSENLRTQKIADERRQDDILQAYLDGMSDLLISKDRPLHRSQPGDSLSTVARARTLTVLNKLDGDRKRSVLQFLFESGLIYKDRFVVDLRGANLFDADLHSDQLSMIDLSRAHLSAASLNSANLSGSVLIEADLGSADLKGANLTEAHLFTEVRGRR
jgi:hypothetical protein